MKKYLFNLIPFILTALCFVAYNLIGSEVLPDGTLSEPFFLIPISWFFFLIGVAWLIINIILSFIHKIKKKI
ncbi:DUF3955 domain-containing protein [Clostridium butyricum]|uniref:DUF3955 domain-containing protein n=1 Tax=Clostridium butyricum TaxID=1492 RepID=UPI0034670190